MIDTKGDLESTVKAYKESVQRSKSIENKIKVHV